MIVKTVGPIGAKMFFLGEAPGEHEDHTGEPFRYDAPAGNIFNKLLIWAQISRAECLVGNVARERPPANKMSFFFEDKQCTIPKPKLRGWLEDLKNEIKLHQPNVVVALGSYALWALTGEKKISTFRGTVMESTLVPGVKVLPTYHPQAVNYTWPLFWTVIMDLKKAKYHAQRKAMTQDKRVLIEAKSAMEFVEYVFTITGPKKKVSLDIEAAQPGSHISILGLSDSPDFAMSIRLIRGNSSCLRPQDELEIWKAVAEMLAVCPVIMQNAPYDMGVLALNHGIYSKKLWMDTLIAAHVCWPETPRDLGYLASLCLDVPAWKHTSQYDQVMYNAADAANTYGIALFLDKEIDKIGARETFNREMAQVKPALMMQLQGLKVDQESQKQLIADSTVRYQEAEVKLNAMVGRKINYNSPKQLQQLLYIDMKLPVQYKRRKNKSDPRKITAGAEAIKKLAKFAPNNPMFETLLEYKQFNKLVTFLDVTVSPSWRVHTSYNITGSSIDDIGRKSFGRWSSSESIILPFGSGNLQNIPPLARKMYRADKGWVILQVDKVQAEAVVVAYLSNNQVEKKLYKDRLAALPEDKPKFDIHKQTAAEMFRIAIETVTKEQRNIGKTIRHATSYVAGPGVVATKLGCTMAQAKTLLEAYYNSKPTLRMWHLSIQNELRNDRVLWNCVGRSHRFLDRWGDSLFRSAISYKPQSTVGDLLNMDLVDIYEEAGSDIEIILQLHDSIYFHIPEKDILKVQRLCLKYYLRPIQVGNETMIIEADFKAGDSWGHQEDLPQPD